MESEDVITFHQNDFHSASFAVFQDMRKRGDLCDFTMNFENRSLSAHRVVLAAGIPYFRTMFLRIAGKIESKEETLPADLDPGVLESLIDFAYSSKVVISMKNIRSFLGASKFLQMNQVFDACVEFLSERMSISKVLEVRSIALTLNISDLIQKSNTVIRDNFEELSTCDDFLTLPYSCVKEIIAEDDLNVSSEEIVFEAVINWVKKSPSERHAILPDLLSEVRMVYLPIDYLVEKVSDQEFIRFSPPCKDLVDEVKNYHLCKKIARFSKMKTQPRKMKKACNRMYAVCESYSLGERSVYCCDFASETWNKVACTKWMSGHIEGVTRVNGKIYMFLAAQIQTFDVETHEWKMLEPTHRSIDDACIICYENIILFFGGIFCPFESKIRCFNTLENRWMEEGIMRTPRWQAAGVSFKESVFVTGGTNDDNILNTVEKYNPCTGQWNEVGSMLTTRTEHGCVAMNGKIYVCGGRTGDCVMRTAEVFDPVTDQWNFVSPMKTGRTDFSLVLCEKKIFVLGGSVSVSKSTQEVEVYDSESDLWVSSFDIPYGFKSAVSIPVTGI